MWASKQCHRLCKKISDEKIDLAKLVSDYNDLASTVYKVEITDALDSNFACVLPDHGPGNRYVNQHYPLHLFHLYLYEIY